MAAVRASSSKSYFALLDLPESYSLDAAELERRYREKSRHWHPDRFSRAPASERAAVLQRATELNEAYRTLRSDGKRAEYLLKLYGVDLADESKKPALDPGFLAEILELREALADARVEGNSAQLADIKNKLTEASSQVTSLYDQIGKATEKLREHEKAIADREQHMQLHLARGTGLTIPLTVS